MAINLGTAFVDIVPSTQGLAPKLREQIEGPLQQSGDRAGRSFGARFSEGLSSLAGSAARMVGTAVQTAAVGAGATLATALVKGYSRVTTIQDATAALTISLGDSAKAASLLKDVLALVQGTPFNFDQFASAAQQLVGMGVEAGKVPGYLKAIGEASATQGGRAGEFAERLSTVFGQIAATGQINLGQVWQISETGVNALAILANSFGVTRDEMKDMITKGAVPAGEALDALAGGILNGTTGAAGATVALAGTMAGLRETLTGAAGGFGAALARLGANIITPFTGALTAGFTGVAGLFDTLGAQFGTWAEQIVAQPGFKRLLAFFEDLPNKVRPGLDALSNLGPALAPLGAAFAALSLGGLAKQFSFLLPMLGAINPLALALAAAFATFVATTPELRAVFEEVASVLGGALQEAFQVIVERLAPQLPTITDALVKIATAFGDILVALAPVIPVLAELAAVLIEKIGVPLLLAFAEGITILASGLTAMGPVFPAIVAGFLAFKAGMVGVTAVMAVNPIVLLIGAIAALALGLVWAYQNVQWFRDAVQAVGRFLADAAGKVADFASALPGAAGAVGRFFSRLPGMAGDALGAVVDWFKALPGLILSALGDLAGALGRFFVEALQKVPLLIGVAIGVVLGVFIGIPFLIIRALLQAGAFLWTEWLWPAIQALPGLIATGFGAVVSFFASLPGLILGAIGDFTSFIWQNVFVRAFNFYTQTLPSIAVGLFNWFAALPGKVIGFLSILPGLLVEFGKKALSIAGGLLGGLVSGVAAVFTWFTELPGKILSKLGSLGRILYDAGKQIMNGLKDGIVAGFRAVTDFVGGIAGRITSLKGPPAYDAKILIKNGQLIMQGLQRGLQLGWNDTARMLSNMTGQIPLQVLPSTAGVGVARTTSQAALAPPAPIALQNYGIIGSEHEMVRWVRDALAAVEQRG